MKGRITSFQRFGGVLGVSSSVVNKFLRSEKLRDMDDGKDFSKGKGIYNNTIPNSTSYNSKYGHPRYIGSNKGEFDAGEEVYGCIAHGYGDSVATPDGAGGADFGPRIEYGLEIANQLRQKTRANSKHFDKEERKWTLKKGTDVIDDFIDSVAIPQENIPLVVNSKFPMSTAVVIYDDDTGEAIGSEIIKCSAGPGFTSGGLARPAPWPEEGYMLVTEDMANMCKLSVPVAVAHGIMHRTKEIKLDVSLEHKIQRSGTTCSGDSSIQTSWKNNFGPHGCPPGTCTSKSYSNSLSCTSKIESGTVTFKGTPSMTAYRYKDVSDIWVNPRTSDISPNYFFGSHTKTPAVYKTTGTACPDEDYENCNYGDCYPCKGPQPPAPTVKKLFSLEKQTKLGAGCLSYRTTNSNMFHGLLEKNLLGKEVSAPFCTKASEGYGLTADPAISFSYLFANYDYWEGFSPGGFRGPLGPPAIINGPELECHFLGTGFDASSQDGKIFQDVPCDCNDYYGEGRPRDVVQIPKASYVGTGIKQTFSGTCFPGHGGEMAHFDNYIANANSGNFNNEGTGACQKCPSEGDNCYSNLGPLRLTLDCMKQCTPYGEDVIYGNNLVGFASENPCTPEIPQKSDQYWRSSLKVGKYVIGKQFSKATQNYGGNEIIDVSRAVPIPLSATKTEELAFWPSFTAGQYGGAFPGVYVSQTFLNKFLAWDASNGWSQFQSNSTRTVEVRNIGQITFKCDDWSDSRPLYGLVVTLKEQTCKGFDASGYSLDWGSYGHSISATKSKPNRYCFDCDDICNNPLGCNGIESETNCCKSTTGGRRGMPCSQSWESSFQDSYDPCANNGDCSGTCERYDRSECPCKCNFCGPDDDDCECGQYPPCEAYQSCGPGLEVTQVWGVLGCPDNNVIGKETVTASLNLTFEFKLFEEME
jgi:hypothetical protein